MLATKASASMGGEEVALHLVTVVLGQEHELCVRFDTLANRLRRKLRAIPMIASAIAASSTLRVTSTMKLRSILTRWKGSCLRCEARSIQFRSHRAPARRRVRAAV